MVSLARVREVFQNEELQDERLQLRRAQNKRAGLPPDDNGDKRVCAHHVSASPSDTPELPGKRPLITLGSVGSRTIRSRFRLSSGWVEASVWQEPQRERTPRWRPSQRP